MLNKRYESWTARLKFKYPSITFARVSFRREADVVKSRERQSRDTNTSGLLAFASEEENNKSQVKRCARSVIHHPTFRLSIFKADARDSSSAHAHLRSVSAVIARAGVITSLLETRIGGRIALTRAEGRKERKANADAPPMSFSDEER